MKAVALDLGAKCQFTAGLYEDRQPLLKAKLRVRTQRGSQTGKNPYDSQKSRAKLKKRPADTFFSSRELDFLDLLKCLPKFLHEVINWDSFFVLLPSMEIHFLIKLVYFPCARGRQCQFCALSL